MSEVLKLEIRRAFRSLGFRISLAAGCLIVLAHLCLGEHCILARAYIFNNAIGTMDIEPASVWQTWMGLQAGAVSYLFFSVFPILAAIPYAASGWEDVRSGYQKQICTRVSRLDYFRAKYAAVFVSGGCAVVFPLLLDFLLCHLFLPAYCPIAVYSILPWNGIGVGLFYRLPYVYVGCYLIVDFVFGGLYASIGLAGTYIFENTVLIQLFPYIFQIVLMFVMGFIPGAGAFFISKLEPSQPYSGSLLPVHYIVHILVFFVLSYGVYRRGGRYREIYH